MRIKYLEAALNQDIQYFDTEVRTSDVVFAINTDAVMVQDAISEKVKTEQEQLCFMISSFLITPSPPLCLKLSYVVFFFLVFVQLGNFIHYMATFVSGFVVGFTAVWQLALVTLAVVPLIAVIGAIHTTTLAKLSGKSQEALSQAGNIVEQVSKNCNFTL
jgi:ATP-binding cassette subfamily B (MDR/TAP) protein 1